MKLPDLLNESLKTAEEYQHRFLLSSHINLALLSHPEVQAVLVPAEDGKEIDFTKTISGIKSELLEIEKSEFDGEISYGFDVQRAIDLAIENRGAIEAVSILDFAHSVFVVLVENHQNGIARAKYLEQIDCVQTLDDLTGMVFGIKAENKSEQAEQQTAEGEAQTTSRFHPVKPNEQDFYGNKDYVEAGLYALTQDKNAVVIISGDKFSGRTSLIQEIINTCNDPKHEKLPHYGLKFEQISQDLNALEAGFAIQLSKKLATATKTGEVIIIDPVAGILCNPAAKAQILELIAKKSGEGAKVILVCDTAEFGEIVTDKALASYATVLRVSSTDYSEDVARTILTESIQAKLSIHDFDSSPDAVSDAVDYLLEEFEKHAVSSGLPLLEKGISAYRHDNQSLRVSMAKAKALSETYSSKGTGHAKAAIKSLDEAKAVLLENVFGQDESIDSLINLAKAAECGFTANPAQPNGIVMALGPTGSGKTETWKVFSEALGMPLIRIDMSEFSERHTVSKLIGAPPGYQGFNEKASPLIESLKANPRSVVLFDEVEKAHPAVHQLLLGVMDNGTLTTGQGEVIEFKDTYIAFTSNAGVELSEGGMSFGATPRTKTLSINESAYERMFSSEFRSRINLTLQYKNISDEVAQKIVVKAHKSMTRYAEKSNKCSFVISDDAINHIVDTVHNELNGARSIYHYYRNTIVPMLLNAMKEVSGTVEGRTFSIELSEEGLTVVPF